MTGYRSSKEELVDSLKAYTSLLAARNEALSQVWNTSVEMRSTLAANDRPNISEALERRNQQIAGLSALRAAPDESEMDAIVSEASLASGEVGELARSVLSLQEDSRSLAERLLECQSECETLLRSRLAATSQAIRQSTQRRKLDAAYGPAVRHDVPTFMDRQR